MTKGSAVFEIIYDPDAVRHLRAIDRKLHAAIRDEIDQQLSHQPDQPTKNRKPLRQPAPWGAAWELRCGHHNQFRVLYRIEDDQRVRVLAIGLKDRNRLLIDGQEWES